MKNADDVLGVLLDRKGFDDWWDTIGDANRADIRQKINQVLSESSPPPPSEESAVAWG